MKRTSFILFLLTNFLFAPFFALAQEMQKDSDSICKTSLVKESLTSRFEKKDYETIKAGNKLFTSLNISNLSPVIYKNTHILSKVYIYDRPVKKDVDNGRLVAINLSSNSYDLLPATTTKIDFEWQSSATTTSGDYRIDIYLVTNGINVVNDFSKIVEADDFAYFRVEGLPYISELYIEDEGKQIDNKDYINGSDFVLNSSASTISNKIIVKNVSKYDKEVNLIWKVYKYGRFDEDGLLYSTTTIKIIKGNSKTPVYLSAPIPPSDKYHSLIDIENNDMHVFDILRWEKKDINTPRFLNFGLTLGDPSLINKNKSPRFPIFKGTKYIAFACIQNKNKNTPTSISLKVIDKNGNIVFEKVDEKISNDDVIPFEYPFISGVDSRDASLEIVARSFDQESVVAWNKMDSNNLVKDVQDIINKIDLKIRYLISILIIIILFAVSYLFRNNSLKFKIK